MWWFDDHNVILEAHNDDVATFGVSKDEVNEVESDDAGWFWNLYDVSALREKCLSQWRGGKGESRYISHF